MRLAYYCGKHLTATELKDYIEELDQKHCETCNDFAKWVVLVYP